jgi:hypothetical protein
MKRFLFIAALAGIALMVGPAGARSLHDDDTVAAAAKKKKQHPDGGTRDDEEKEESVRSH